MPEGEAGRGEQVGVAARIERAGLDGYATRRVTRPHFPRPDPEAMLHHLVLDHAGPHVRCAPARP